MTRAPVPDPVQEQVLAKCARRCALCFGLDGSLTRKRGQIAHIDQDSANSAFENLAYLCLDHHDEYDSVTSQSKGFTERELRNYRNRLYDAIAAGAHHDTGERTASVRGDLAEHDRAVFRAGDAIMDEPFLQDFLRFLELDHSYEMGRLDRLVSFTRHFENEGARYLTGDLLAVLDELRERLEALDDFLAVNFFVYPEVQDLCAPDAKLCMHPGQNLDRGGVGTREETAFYDEHARTLRTLVAAAGQAYAEYRRTVKRTLLV